jgi:hypothetical protein
VGQDVWDFLVFYQKYHQLMGFLFIGKIKEEFILSSKITGIYPSMSVCNEPRPIIFATFTHYLKHTIKSSIGKFNKESVKMHEFKINGKVNFVIIKFSQYWILHRPT